jgi:hypothetical protein
VPNRILSRGGNSRPVPNSRDRPGHISMWKCARPRETDKYDQMASSRKVQAEFDQAYPDLLAVAYKAATAFFRYDRTPVVNAHRKRQHL